LHDISTPLHKQQEEDTEVEEEDQDQKFDSKYLDKKLGKPLKKQYTNANRLLMMQLFDGVNEFKAIEAESLKGEFEAGMMLLVQPGTEIKRGLLMLENDKIIVFRPNEE
jgi:hypothetical protein